VLTANHEGEDEPVYLLGVMGIFVNLF
jgi:hypothetical protein